MPSRLEYMSDEDLKRDMERHAANEKRRQEKDLERVRAEEKRKLEESKRDAELERIIAKRAKEPQDYDPPTQVADLKVKIENGSLYFCHLQLSGITIDFDLKHANLSRSSFHRCNFKDCSLESAQLVDARFENCTFENADVSGADFERARFSNCRGLLLDNNFTRGATFGPTPTDRWHVLKGAYAGHGQAFQILFSILYFGPIVLKVGLLYSIATVQARLNPDLHAQLKLSPRPIYSLIYNENGFLWYLAVGVLLYQAFRIALTYRVGPLVDRENATGYAPGQSEYSRYWHAHQVVRVLGFAALVALAIHSWYVLRSTVWLPDAMRLP